MAMSFTTHFVDVVRTAASVAGDVIGQWIRVELQCNAGVETSFLVNIQFAGVPGV